MREPAHEEPKVDFVSRRPETLAVAPDAQTSQMGSLRRSRDGLSATMLCH